MCNREAASVEELSKKWADKVQFIGIASMGATVDFQAFVAKYSLTFPQIDDADGELFDDFNIPATPGLVVVETDGGMQGRIGAVGNEELEILLTQATS